ncbi:hypothetical protein GMM82_004922, partial [Escherichia coli]|nr:hypothetical protein [Escherichia coli]EJN0014374.1 hypothetical protein [Escherichia coli]EKJ0169522.1 hypothetical protein [Escherichia coli]
ESVADIAAASAPREISLRLITPDNSDVKVFVASEASARTLQEKDRENNKNAVIVLFNFTTTPKIKRERLNNVAKITVSNF